MPAALTRTLFAFSLLTGAGASAQDNLRISAKLQPPAYGAPDVARVVVRISNDGPVTTGSLLFLHRGNDPFQYYCYEPRHEAGSACLALNLFCEDPATAPGCFEIDPIPPGGTQTCTFSVTRTRPDCPTVAWRWFVYPLPGEPQDDNLAILGVGWATFIAVPTLTLGGALALAAALFLFARRKRALRTGS